jgi:hypothetical protein
MRRTASPLISLLVLAACGGGTNTSHPADASGSGNPDGAVAPDAPPLVGTKYSVSWGPVDVAPGQEDTRCIVVNLKNPTAVKIHQIHNVLGPSSHHLIVYRDGVDTVESLTPTHCTPFAGTLTANAATSPLMITQKKDDALTLPDGVAYSLVASQMLRLEMHFINTTDATVTLNATSDFYAVPDSTIQNEADFLFIGTPDISLAPGATSTVSEFFTMPSSLAGANFFAITGHTHQYGTDMHVESAPSTTGAKTSVYAPSPFVWSEPATTTHNPTFTVPAGGGFQFTCGYHNTSAAQVNFGESATAEMCFFWAYYYPSKGSHVCFHTTQFNGGIDVCCPDAGAQICSMLIR